MSLVNYYPTVFPFSTLLVIRVSIREEGINGCQETAALEMLLQPVGLQKLSAEIYPSS